jgi:hypothetical protein
VEKKIKNIAKKLKAIDDLKAKLASGAQLELTQISKILSEAVLRKEVSLVWDLTFSWLIWIFDANISLILLDPNSYQVFLHFLLHS